MTTALILSGGVFHDCPATSGLLAAQLRELGCEAEITEDLEAGLARLDQFDLLVVNALRWRMLGEKYDPYRDSLAYSPSAVARKAVVDHLERGRGLLAMHSAVICFDDWPGWGDILGAQWAWGRSGHPPLGPVHIHVEPGAHPLARGLGDFELEDEIYGFLDQRPGLEPQLTSPHGGADHPLLWVKPAHGGRVAVDLLGHGPESYAVPEHRTIIGRAMAWVLQ